MNDRTAFYNKLIYLGIIAALLLPLNLLGRPSAGTTAEVQPGGAEAKYSGGVLSKFRDENRLSQSSLGKIDPVSESFKLATLGLRPIAVAILWQNAHYYKKTEDWSNNVATLEQIKLLQPNYIKVWDFLSHEIAFNLSVEFDDWRHRYEYVVRGLQYLIDGTEYNAGNALLLSRVGFFITQKIGKSDDHVNYRRTFAKDEKLHLYMAKKLGIETTPRDSWLVGKKWYERAVEAADKPNCGSLNVAAPIFYSFPAMAQIDYANGLEEDGNFEHAQEAWNEAKDNLTALGNRLFSDYRGGHVRLNDREDFEKKVAETDAELEKLADAKLKEQTPDARLALVARAPEEKRAAARRLAEEAQTAFEMANSIAILRGFVNFDYWLLRCKAEATPEAIAARKLIYQATEEQKESSLTDATKQLFEQGFAQWGIVIKNFPGLVVDQESGEPTSVSSDLYDDLKSYRKFLSLRGEKIPKDFALKDVLERHDKRPND